MKEVTKVNISDIIRFTLRKLSTLILVKKKFFCRILKPILFTMQMHFQCKIQKPKIKAQKYCLHSCNMLRSSQRWSKSRKCDVYVVFCDFINAMCGLRTCGMFLSAHSGPEN